MRTEVSRKQRRSDGTVTVDGVRFEVPAAYRTLLQLRLRVARWDLASVNLVDPRSGDHLVTLLPIDKARNAERIRRVVAPADSSEHARKVGIAPHLRALMAEYAATGLPPAYLPKHDPTTIPTRTHDQAAFALRSQVSSLPTGRPADALFTTPAVDSFVRRVELGIADGGFAMITGDPGTGKSIALRVLSERLRALPDVLVGTVEHPQSRTMDFYRELGDLFAVPLAAHNRWAGFKALRTRWADHIGSSRCRPVLIIDEAQETLTPVLCELRILASKELDSSSCSVSSSQGTRDYPRGCAPGAAAPRLTHSSTTDSRLRLARRAPRVSRPLAHRRRQSVPDDQRVARHARRSRRRQLPRAHESRR